VVNEFYGTSNAASSEFKPQLDQWLKMAQNSPQAWTFSWQLVEANKSAECQFYAASCLYTKVSKYIGDVPVDEYDTLKNKLLEKLILYASMSVVQQQVRLVQRKLNSTLAKLALYLIEDQWQQCVIDIMQTIPNLNVDESTMDKSQLVLIVIDLFTLLPEEFQTLNVAKPKRAIINQKLQKNFPLIADYLLNIFVNCRADLANATSASTQIKLIECSIKCVNSWIGFGIEFEQTDRFVPYLFEFIYVDCLFDACVECLTALFSCEDYLK
jgi:hypothetical protein